ncbi:MAG: nitroreductase [Hyphomicrobiaceae bacterium]|nr:MAG: nitroreductase [Hyphomicrobiaceae bacterium]
MAKLADLIPVERRAVGEAISSRRSVRGFLPTPVPRAQVEAILALAARAPSGSNIQPWKAYVCAGAKRDAVVAAVREANEGEPDAHREAYAYYPDVWREPYLTRRRATGWGLYGTLGIAKGDTAAMQRQRAKNFEFFGAPVGLFLTIDDDMERGSWLDCGMFLQNVMIAARAFELHTCPQQAWAHYHRIVKPLMGIPESEILVCGMALGHLDEAEPANRFWTDRVPVAAFAQLQGFDTP